VLAHARRTITWGALASVWRYVLLPSAIDENGPDLSAAGVPPGKVRSAWVLISAPGCLIR